MSLRLNTASSRPIPAGIALQLDCAQAKGVTDHRKGTETHGRAGPNRTNENPKERIENPRGDRDADDVVGKCQKEVLPDRSNGLST